MLVRIQCSHCPSSARIDTDRARVQLRATTFGSPQGLRTGYAFGDHVRDERAFAMRYMTLAGWATTRTPLGKSTVTMQCAQHAAQIMHGAEGE